MKKNGWAVKFEQDNYLWWLCANRECELSDNDWQASNPRYVFADRKRAVECLRYARARITPSCDSECFKLIRIGNPSRPESKLTRAVAIINAEIEKEEDYLNECRDGDDYAEALKAEERIAAHEWTLEQLENL